MEQPPIALSAENEIQIYYPQAPSSGNNPSLFGLDMIDYLNEDQRNSPLAPSSGSNHSLIDPFMKGDWDKVLELYGEHQSARTEMLSMSQQTALHIAITFNDQESRGRQFHLNMHIGALLNAIPDKWSYIVLGSKDIDGNTPLHLAAAQGNDQLCNQILTKCREVSDIKNNDNATPLYLAVHHGRLKAYRCLRECDKKWKRTVEQEVWLAKDGNTILHSAIKGGNFRLAFEIIDDYKETVDRVNGDGESPLHVLAKRPHFFFSSCQLGFYASIVYHIVHVRKLKSKENEVERPTSKPMSVSYPRNYQTCVDIVDKVIRRLFDFTAKIFWKRRSCGDDGNSVHKDEENQQYNVAKDDRFPPNYATCYLCLQTAAMFLLVIFGMRRQKIKKVRERKERHTWATQIMHKLLNLEPTSYKYNDGQAPIAITGSFCINRPPYSPPLLSDYEESEDELLNRLLRSPGNPLLGDDRQYHLHYSPPGNPLLGDDRQYHKHSETPFLIAAKTGILEMVEAILKKFQVAINDLDKNKKNALLLAIEHRQPRVFDFLIALKFPEFVRDQVDDQGNGARHLSALSLRDENNPWHLPGSALQMHGEVTWYKHVKKFFPLEHFAYPNYKGQTPKDIFKITHEALAKEGTEWLIKTSESCSVIAALIATVAFSTSTTVPGGVSDDTGLPTLSHHVVFTIFAIASVSALYFSLTALVSFLSIVIIASRGQVWDYKKDLPHKLLTGLTSLFSSIVAILVSFNAGAFFVLTKSLRFAAFPTYIMTSVPLITYFALAQLPLYAKLLRIVVTKRPARSYKLSYR